MELEQLAVTLRPRRGMEAIDLGFAMVRRWWLPVYGAWLSVYLPVALLLHVALHDELFLAMVVLWWLKPAFDRVVLHVLGKAVFGAVPTVSETLRAWREFLHPGLIASLTLYRFDTARSFNLPIWQLERSSGVVARRRAAVLHRRARTYAVALTVICINLELVALFGLIGLVQLLTPAPLETDMGWWALIAPADELPAWRQWLSNLFYLAAVTLVEPLYVAGGFALYLARRTQLEAWDIELALRRVMAERERLALRVVAWAAIAVVAFLLAGAPVPAAAAEPKDAREQLQAVLADKAFDQEREVKTWRYTGRGWDWGSDDDARDKPRDWSNLGKFIAEIARALGWIVAALALGWLAILFARHAGGWLPGKSAGYHPPATLFGLDVRPESLPADVAAAALALARNGRLREGLSLLYRGALSVLAHSRGIELLAGDTEGDCVRRVARDAPEPTARYFGQLVRAWQGAAYASRLPDPADVERLCADWAAHFAQEVR